PTNGNHAPAAGIRTPDNDMTYTSGTSITFYGYGADYEDGLISGSSLVWTSNRDGIIGTGLTFARSTLSVGTHTITVTATDTQGATGTAVVTVTIKP
ncbi:MAG: proprotein convertase P, partial [Gemmatimonadota bacterium]|nr:proprotein convertase P [Gemmatimonadota bacterium]